MQKINLSNSPTKVVKLENLSKKYGKNIFLKRDDFTGTEVSGNKIRKLEYAMAQALDSGCDVVITRGAIQSNHCRATAAVCASLGLDCHLLLKGEPGDIEGNLFLDYMLGANIHFFNDASDIDNEMLKLFNKLELTGKKPYIIPMGASNPIGTYGYIDAYNEILEQEKELSINFDIISIPVGSGGTYGGLWYGNYIKHKNKRILGFSVSDSSEHFKDVVINILDDIDDNIGSYDSIEINDLYVGDGYGLATREELELYYDIAKSDGVVFDPCYTGKAFRGLLEEIKSGNITEENILFIHTGGLLGWTKSQRNLIYEIAKEKTNEI